MKVNYCGVSLVFRENARKIRKFAFFSATRRFGSHNRKKSLKKFDIATRQRLMNSNWRIIKWLVIAYSFDRFFSSWKFNIRHVVSIFFFHWQIMGQNEQSCPMAMTFFVYFPLGQYVAINLTPSLLLRLIFLSPRFIYFKFFIYILYANRFVFFSTKYIQYTQYT